MKKMDGKFKISLLFLAVILIIPVIGPHLIRHDPYAVNVRNAFLSPCKEYLFGTDNLGRCVFCRILAGSRTSIYTALLIVGIVFLVGTLVGILAGFAHKACFRVAGRVLGETFGSSDTFMFELLSFFQRGQ